MRRSSRRSMNSSACEQASSGVQHASTSCAALHARRNAIRERESRGHRGSACMACAERFRKRLSEAGGRAAYKIAVKSSRSPCSAGVNAPTLRAMSDSRPDPDALLARSKRGGGGGRARQAPDLLRGLGGRGQDLRDARRRAARARRGHRDVVVGVVETHGRAETLALIEGLEVLPRREIERQGRKLTEFDIDAALARQPAPDPRRRARAHQRAGLAPPEALAGRRGAARRGHRRLHDAQRAAPREPERRRGRHHRHQGVGDGARHVLRRRPTRWCWSTCPPRSCWSA